jgi:ribonuclease HI
MLEIYTDGSAKPNPGRGGCAVAITINDILIKTVQYSGGYTTNNCMELTAVIIALKNLPNTCNGIIYTDSMYVKQGLETWIHNWIKKGWKTADGKPVKNIDLWQKLYTEKNNHPNIQIKWIKAHNGHKWNDLVDKLANSASLLIEKEVKCNINKNILNTSI